MELMGSPYLLAHGMGAPDRSFISKAVHNRAIDRKMGYPIPYRCFYSRNVPNLFKARRNVSVTREALGTIRVMKTIGMMGVVVGKAASICRVMDADLRGIYERYLLGLEFLILQQGETGYESLGKLRKALAATDKKSWSVKSWSSRCLGACRWRGDFQSSVHARSFMARQ